MISENRKLFFSFFFFFSILSVATATTCMISPVCDRFIVDQTLIKVAFGSTTCTYIVNICKLASSLLLVHVISSCNQAARAEAETFRFIIVATKHASDCACSTLLKLRSGGRYSTYVVKLFSTLRRAKT